MRPEQEIARIQRDYAAQWPELEKIPAIQKAMADNDPITLGQEVAKAVYGDHWTPTKQELEAGMEEYEWHKMDKLRADLIRKKKSN